VSVLYICLSVCESINIHYPLYLLLKASFRVKVSEKNRNWIKISIFIKCIPNVSRRVQRYVDRKFFIHLGTVFLF